VARGTARPAAAPGSGQGVCCTPSWRAPDLIGLPARLRPVPVAVASQVPPRDGPGAGPLRQPRERRQVRGCTPMSTVVDDREVRPLPRGLRGRHNDDLKHRRRLDRPGCLHCLRGRGHHRGGEEQRDDDRQARPPTPPCRARRAPCGHEVHATVAAPVPPGTSLIDNTACADVCAMVSSNAPSPSKCWSAWRSIGTKSGSDRCLTIAATSAAASLVLVTIPSPTAPNVVRMTPATTGPVCPRRAHIGLSESRPGPLVDHRA